nr:nickel transporter [Kibdelosporangium sp. MJ126-NF4]CEL20694.1 Inner membrane protein [Kibdelosporangium sp. MJ126-NF4]CTQ89607.1 Inner membrane protein [Kibdelosporangium sp. MJ126-NF4]
MRSLVRAVLVTAVALPALLLVGGHADAHPLGNFSVNHYNGLHLRPDRVDLKSVVDLAEIPTLQERSIDAARECGSLAAAVKSSVDSVALVWTVRSSHLEHPRGQADLATTRLTCDLTAPVEIRGPVTLTFSDSFRPDRVGWREITAVGSGVSLDSPVPAASVSDELRQYPDDLLASPLDVRAVSVKAQPGQGSAVTGPAPPAGGGGLLDRASLALADFVGTRELTPLIGMLAVLLSLVLGASHAALPGHGKTVIAAYLVGRRGTPKDAIVVGATVTVTHTAGVLVLGLLLSLSSVLAGESVLRWLGAASGLLIAGIGVVLLRSAARDRAPVLVGRGHGHGHGHGHGPRFGRGSLIGMGVAGGLVPSPSALVVLLGAVALGRTWFGVLLGLAYGLGMAAMLTAAGLLLVRFADRFDGWTTRPRMRRLVAAAPSITAAMVLLVGVGLTARAVLG